MKFFQNKAVAVVLAVIAVLAAPVLSAKVQMTRDLNRVHSSFFLVEGKAPVYYVDQMISAAASLAAVGSHYDALAAQADQLRQCRKTLVEAEASRDVSDIYDACAALTAAAESFSSQAEEAALTAADRSAVADGSAAVSGAMRELRESDYNSDVRELLRKNYERFPASFFAGLLNIPRPELFSEVQE